MRLMTSLKGGRQESGWVEFETDVAPVRLVFLTPEIVRIRAGFTGDFTEESYSLVHTAWDDRLDGVVGPDRRRTEPLQADYRETDSEYIVSSDVLTVRLQKAPFVIRIENSAGELLHSDVVGKSYFEDNNGRRVHSVEIFDGDHFYGFGEKTGHLDKRGEFMVMNPQDSMGYDAAKTDSLYKHIPFYIRLNEHSKIASGYFYHNTFECSFDMGRSHSNYWPKHSTYRTDGGDIDLFFIAGPSVHDVIRRYTDLTGTSALLPRQALGYLGSSMFYAELPERADQAILQFMDSARELDFPIDGFQLSSGYTEKDYGEGEKRYVFEWSDARFPEPEGFFAATQERDVLVSPNVKPALLTSHPKVPEMIEQGVLVRQPSSDEPSVGHWWGGPGVFLDFTDPAGRAYWTEQLKESLLGRGVQSIWNDNCEYDGLVDKDARVAFDGKESTIWELKPVMANLMCQVTAEALSEAYPERRPFVVCRAGYAGIQRFAQTWSGDNATSWATLRYNVATMLGMSLSGVANQGSDIGGFHGPAPSPELLVRWVQSGITQPRFSIHSASVDNTVTEPWMYEATSDLVRDAIRFRYRLMPYLYSLMVRAHRTGLPIVEPLIARYQEDPSIYDEDTTYMLGDLLVATVLEEGATTRRVQFPGTEPFYGIFDHSRHAGGGVVEVPVGLSDIPMYLRGGGIVVFAENEVCSTLDPVKDIHVLIHPERDGWFEMVEDDGVSPHQGAADQRNTRISVTSGARVSIDIVRDGEYQSAVETVTWEVVAPSRAPYWVDVDGERVQQYLRRDHWEAASSGWFYSNDSGTAFIKAENSTEIQNIVVCFEQFDLIGM